MLFLNNDQVMHARTEFEDHGEPERERHLMRRWLYLHNGRALSPKLDNRETIVTTDRDASDGIRRLVLGAEPSAPAPNGRGIRG